MGRCHLHLSTIAFLITVTPIVASHVNEPFVDQPTPTELSTTEKKILILYLDHLGINSPERYYRLAQFYIQTGELEKAKESLCQALRLDADYAPAYLQLGFIDLWEKHYDDAKETFSTALDIAPCDSKALLGMAKLGIHWSQTEEGKQIAEELKVCSSYDPDYLFYFGTLLVRLHEWEEAEAVLKKCLKIAPQYVDANLEMANLYTQEKKFLEAEKIYFRYPKNIEAQKGLAKIALTRRNYKEAEGYYRKILKTCCMDLEARKGLGQALTSQLNYRAAKKQYEQLLQCPSARKDESNWIQLMDIQSHTNVGMLEEVSYTDAKEGDPTLGVPVVKDYFFSSKLAFLIPIFDRWRLDAQQLYLHQRENNIFAPSVNYSAFVNGAQLISHYFFLKDWKWDVIAKGVQASGTQQANFPFQNSALFEPGTVLQYLSNWHLFFLDGHVEDQIVKNFSLTVSQLLRIDVYQGCYGFHPPIYLRPLFEGWVGQSYYHDSLNNRKDYQKVRAGIDLGDPSLRASYLFEHGTFRKLSQDYFSYQRQIQHTLTIKYVQSIYSQAFLEVWWDHIWQSNHQVFLPIGNFVFVASNMYLIWNRITADLEYRFKNHFRAKFGGHYLRISFLPYHDWNLHGSILWQF